MANENLLDLIDRLRQPQKPKLYESQRPRLYAIPDKAPPSTAPDPFAPQPPPSEDRIRLSDFQLPRLGAGNSANDDRIVLRDTAPLANEQFGIPTDLIPLQNQLPRLSAPPTFNVPPSTLPPLGNDLPQNGGIAGQVPLPTLGAKPAFNVPVPNLNDPPAPVTQVPQIGLPRLGAPPQFGLGQNTEPVATTNEGTSAEITNRPLLPLPTLGGAAPSAAPAAPTDGDNQEGWSWSGLANVPNLPTLGGGNTGQPQLTPSQQAAAEIDAVQKKKYGFEKNADGSYKLDANGKKIPEADRDKTHDWKDILRSAALGGLQGMATGNLGGAIGGAIAGGVAGGIDRNFDNKIQDQIKLSKLLPRLGQAQQQEVFDANMDAKKAQTDVLRDKPNLAREQMAAKVRSAVIAQQNRLDVINRQADIKSGEAKIYTDSDGKQWKQFLKPDATGKTREMEPIVNPTTGEQEFAPGEQMVDWADPLTGATIRVKAKQVLMPDATAAGTNAQRAQQADTFNASQEFEAQKTNAANLVKFNGDALAQAIRISEASGKAIENLADVKGYATEIDGLKKQLDELGTDFSQDFSGEKRKSYNIVLTKIAEADNKYQQALGKSEAGNQAVEFLKSQNINRPPSVSAVKIQAQQVGGGISSGGGIKFTADEIRTRGKSHGLTDAQIEAKIQEAQSKGLLR